MRPPPPLLSHPSCVLCHEGHTHTQPVCLSPLPPAVSLTTTHAHILHVSIRGGGRSVFRAAFQVDRTLIHQTPALCRFVSAATFRVKEEH